MRLILVFGIVAILLIKEHNAASCGKNAFKCKRSDQCVQDSDVCDQNVDCVDGSDESYAACSEKRNRSIPRCLLPALPKNGHYYSHLCDFKTQTGNCTDFQRNSLPNGYILHYKCNYGFSLRGNPDVICAAGHWEPKLPYCSNTCEPVSSKKLTIVCTKGKTVLPCDEPLPNRAKATFDCNSETAVNIKAQEYNVITCRNGKWDRPLEDDFCRADCGRANFRTYTDLVDDVVFNKFPWHAGVYQLQEDNSWQQVCGGTLISDKVIISSAQCFTDANTGRRYPDIDRNFKIALGKNSKHLYDSSDPFVQVYDIKTVRIPSTYRGISNLKGDIAAVILDRPVTFGNSVRPICMDIGELSIEEDQLVDGTQAELPGWGLSFQRNASNFSRIIELNYVPGGKCHRDLPASSKQYVTSDKFCAESKGSVVTCPNDVGGGLVFQNYGIYYLRGVLSMPNRDCKETNMAFFTKVSNYKDMIEVTTDCKLPPVPQFGSYNVFFTQLYENQTVKNVRTLSYSCLEGFSLVGKSSTVRCQDGVWYPEIPACTDKCGPLKSKVLAIDCYEPNGGKANCDEPSSEGMVAKFRCNSLTHVKVYEPEYNEIKCKGSKWNNKLLIDFCKEKSTVKSNHRRDVCLPPKSAKLTFVCLLRNNSIIPCSQSVPVGTKAHFQCLSPAYLRLRPFPYNYVTCKKGKWDKLLPEDFCRTVCGEAMSKKLTPVIGHGKNSNYGEFPWHVAIYSKLGDNNWQYICGGSIISRKAIITAAHCIADVNTGERIRINKSPDSLLVVAGKYHRELNVTDEQAQARTVEFVYTPEMYLGLARLLAEDIGFLVLMRPLDFNAFIRPVCLDIGRDSFEEDQLVEGAIGNVTGWGLQEGLQQSHVLKVAQLPYVPRSVCVKNIDRNLVGHVLYDKFCAGNLSSEMAVCTGDSGGGIVFYRPSDKAYYLRGIVSVGGKYCEGKEYSLFTRVSTYREMVKYFVEMEQFDSHDLNNRLFGSTSSSTLSTN